MKTFTVGIKDIVDKNDGKLTVESLLKNPKVKKRCLHCKKYFYKNHVCT